VHVSRTNAEVEPNRLHLSTRAAIVGKCCFSFFLCWFHLVLNGTELINSSFLWMTNVPQNGRLGLAWVLDVRCAAVGLTHSYYTLTYRRIDVAVGKSIMRPGDHKLFENQGATSKFRTRCRSWLRHCTTSWKVAGSIPDCVIGIFHWHNNSGRTVALGLTQPLTEMSEKVIPLQARCGPEGG